MLAYHTTPTQEVHDQVLKDAEIRLFVKREDLNHPYVSGNKWWKLKNNLQDAREQQCHTLLTFGGSYSNHIYATSAAAYELGFDSIGIIRGEEVLPLNPTLHFAKKQGMELRFFSREAYRQKSQPHFIDQLRSRFGDFYLIPEGGTNELAVTGVAEFTQTLDLDFDYLCCAVGTGGTLAGLIRGLSGEKKILGFSSLKEGAYLNGEVRNLESRYLNWEIIAEYHFGGYAKSTAELLSFIADFKTRHHIPLEFIYTAKMFYGIFDLAKKGFFKKGASVLAIHSGGIRHPTSVAG